MGLFKNLFLLVIVITFIAFIFSPNEDTSSSSDIKISKPAKIKPSEQQITQVISLLKSENTEVHQAIYNEGGAYNWIVGVNAPSDGQGSWKGYASAMCNTLYEVNVLSKDKSHNSTIDHGVRVVDISKFNSTNGSFRKSSLGSANCKTWEMSNI